MVEKKGKAKDEYYGKLILDLGNEVCSSVEQGMAAMEKLVERIGNVEEEVECKKLRKELEEARFSNTFLRMQNERVERDLYWTRVQAHKFYQEMIRRGFVFEERPNKDIDVSVKDEELSRLDAIGCSDLIMPPKYAHLTQAAIRQMIKESVDAAIAAERARHANVENDARGSGPVRGAIELQRWFEKTESVFEISDCTEGKKVKFAATTLQGPTLTWWNAKVATMGLETVNQMPWTEMKQLMTTDGDGVVFGGSGCGGYDVEGGDGGAAWSGSEVGGAWQWCDDGDNSCGGWLESADGAGIRWGRRKKRGNEEVSGKAKKLSGMPFYIKLL
nr:putative reverse transcriptase domain-containing protein [Tanacetum cinerariifolium]